MDYTSLKNVSMNGRMAYAIMCVESYIIEKYPQKNWSILFLQLWKVTNCGAWDDWFEKSMEFIPEYLFEFNDYKSSKFDFITESEYNSLRELYKDVQDEANQLLLKVLEIEEVYCYTNIPGCGQECLDIIQSIISILENSGINPPDPSLVSFSKFSERFGWGEHFDGTKLSIVLNKD